MQIIDSEKNGITILSVSGRMDATNVNEFDTACHAKLENSVSRMIIDLKDLEYISSAGLRGILSLEKSVRAGKKKIAYCAMQPMVADVFKISGFNSILAIYSSLDEALAALS